MGKVSAHPVEVSTITRKYLHPDRGSIWVKSNCQSSPGYVPLRCIDLSNEGGIGWVCGYYGLIITNNGQALLVLLVFWAPALKKPFVSSPMVPPSRGGWHHVSSWWVSIVGPYPVHRSVLLQRPISSATFACGKKPSNGGASPPERWWITLESCNLKGGPLKHLPYMGRYCHCRVFDLKIIYLMISPWEQLAEQD